MGVRSSWGRMKKNIRLIIVALAALVAGGVLAWLSQGFDKFTYGIASKINPDAGNWADPSA